ncbi:MAG: diacylglycerol kinase [Dehalococcoidia bacterium]|nr:diacylglycerol kinase [Dehalococcoidia bacterium]
MLDFKRLIRATMYSFSGLRDALAREPAFRLEVALTLILIPVAIWLGGDPVEWALMIGTLLVVLIVELLNSAIEAVADRFGSEFNDLSKRAKDMGSAAVFVSLLLVAAVWGLMLLS